MRHRVFTGRTKVVTDYDRIDLSNVKQALGEANARHIHNAADIRWLFNYYRGRQPIYDRVKEVRPDICYNMVINIASEIVSFKVSYLLGDPMVYVAKQTSASEGVTRLNDFMTLAGQKAADKELADDFTICGQAYRFVYPNKDYDGTNSPFILHTLDPENTFVAYKNSPYKQSEPVFAVTSMVQKGVGNVYDVFTKDTHYMIVNGEVRTEPNQLGDIPIIEYLNNEFRIGAFEPVLDLMDAANALESNRVEATEQNVQALTWFNDVELEADEVASLKQSQNAFVFTRTLKGQTAPSIKAIMNDLQQQDQQVLQNDLYRKIMLIVGMPSVSDGTGNDSSNNGSTLVRNGWTHAEARAKDTAILWERSDRRFLRLALKICEDMGCPCGISVTDVVGKFTRRNYEDIQTKATVLTTMLGSDKVHPEFAYQVSGIAPDPEEACKMGLEWYEEHRDDQNTGEAGFAGASQRGAGSGQPGGA